MPNCGASAFFLSIILWGIGVGCFAALLNNFLADIYDIDGYERGWIEFFRELPGLLLVFILAAINKMSDWKIMRLGTAISAIAAALMILPVDTAALTLLIFLFSTGEHLVMPVRFSIAMLVAKPRRTGASLGLLTSCINAGTVVGSVIVASVFLISRHGFGMDGGRHTYDIVWLIIIGLLAISLASTFTKNAPNSPSKKPRLYFRKKFWRFYALELFYGVRKQIFLTFGPYLLIIEYNFGTGEIAALMAFCALVNVFGSPVIGRLTDRFGYRKIMIWDTVILFFVCMMYGYAGKIFPHNIAVVVLCVNYIFDNLMSTTSMATNIYAKTLASTKDELTSTLSSGLSVNHLISIMSAPIGGWIWVSFGIEYLFTFAGLMALLNSAFALTLPKPKD